MVDHQLAAEVIEALDGCRRRLLVGASTINAVSVRDPRAVLCVVNASTPVV